MPALETLRQDLRLALRGLRTTPALAVAAVLTLALGIGVNSALFSVIDGVLLTPPPFAQPGRLVMVWSSNPELAHKMGLADKIPVSPADFYAWQEGASSLSHLALFGTDRVNLTGQGEPEQLTVAKVSGDFFAVLQTSAVLGRTLQPGDDVPGQPAAVVLSQGLWQRKFGGDRGIVGRSIQLSGHPLTVVGVMPPGFAFPSGVASTTTAPALWLPTGLSAEERQNHGNHNEAVIGRLKPGVALKKAEAELRTVAARLAQSHPDSNQGWGVRVESLAEATVGELRPALLILWGAVGLVLLIACANVANLLLARAAGRQREIAIRRALGAGQGRLVAHMLTESGLLALLGGGLGIAVGAGALRVFAAYLPADATGGAVLALSGRVLAFTALLAVLTCLLAGLAPALQMTRPNLTTSLREGGRVGSGGSQTTRRLLVVAEVAIAVLLLVCAGLLLRSFGRLLAVDPGFRAANLLSFELTLPEDRFTPPQRRELFDRLLTRLQALPGVTGAGAVSGLPMDGESIKGFEVEGRAASTPDHRYLADAHYVTPSYLEAMGIALRSGRGFAATDTADAPGVIVVDEVLARTFWPGESPLGKRLRSGRPGASEAPWLTVVGVVANVRSAGLHVAPRPQTYLPQSQAARSRMTVVLRSTGEPTALAAAARAAVHEIDHDLPLSQMRTMEEVVAASLAGRRFNVLLLGLFAGLALALAAMGIFGTTAYSVAQRTREMGLRMALGSRPGAVVRLVVGEAGRLAALGILLGLAAAWGGTRVMSSLLYGVGPTDPVAFLGGAAGLLAIALAAAAVPGLRATRVDPMVALRE